MAAANTDKFRKKKNTFSTNLNGAITAGATTLTCDSLSGVPTDTAVTITVDRVDANDVSTPSLREDITGVVSGSNLTNLVRGEGATTAQSHVDNAVVEITWETETWNDAVDGILAEHNQDGTHGAITSDSVTAQTTNGDLQLKGNGTGTVKKPASIIVQVEDGATNLSTGDGKAYLTIPEQLDGLNLSAVHARVITAPTGANLSVQIHNVTDAVDMLSTALTIDTSETGSDTAATAAVIDTSNDDVSTNDLIRIDVDQVGSTVTGAGLIVRLEFDLP